MSLPSNADGMLDRVAELEAECQRLKDKVEVLHFVLGSENSPYSVPKRMGRTAVEIYLVGMRVICHMCHCLCEELPSVQRGRRRWKFIRVGKSLILCQECAQAVEDGNLPEHLLERSRYTW